MSDAFTASAMSGAASVAVSQAAVMANGNDVPVTGNVASPARPIVRSSSRVCTWTCVIPISSGPSAASGKTSF
jgi:hypothetical protein